ILDADSIEPLEWVTRADGNHEPLVVERQGMKPIVEIIRSAEDRDIDLALRQKLLQCACRRVLEIDLNTLVVTDEAGEEVDKPVRSYCAHEADCQIGLIQPYECLGLPLRLSHLREDLFEIGPHHPPQLGQVRVPALAIDQRSAELLFQVLNGSRQGWL